MKRNHTNQTLAWRWFWAVTAWPKTIIVLGLVMVIGFTVYVPDLYQYLHVRGHRHRPGCGL